MTSSSSSSSSCALSPSSSTGQVMKIARDFEKKSMKKRLNLLSSPSPASSSPPVVLPSPAIATPAGSGGPALMQKNRSNLDEENHLHHHSHSRARVKRTSRTHTNNNNHFSEQTNLILKCEYEIQMYKLASEYYKRKDLRCYVIPLTTITIISSILSFLGASSNILGVEDLESHHLLWSFIVGVLCVISLMIQSLNGSNNAVKSELHKSVAMRIKKLQEKYIIFLSTCSQNDDEIEQTVHYEIISSLLSSSSSSVDHEGEIPSFIYQAYSIVNSRLAMMSLATATTSSVSSSSYSHNIMEEQEQSKTVLYISVYNELYMELSSQLFSSQNIMKQEQSSVKKAVDKAIQKVFQSFHDMVQEKEDEINNEFVINRRREIKRNNKNKAMKKEGPTKTKNEDHFGDDEHDNDIMTNKVIETQQQESTYYVDLDRMERSEKETIEVENKVVDEKTSLLDVS